MEHYNETSNLMNVWLQKISETLTTKKIAKVSWEVHYATMSSIYGTVPYTVRKIIPVKRNVEVKCMKHPTIRK